MTASYSRPTILLTPGGWHSPRVYDLAVRALEAHNYPALSILLHSVGASPPDPSIDNDVAAIRQNLTKLVEQEGKDVVLVSHSYSGVPISEAPRGLTKPERRALIYSAASFEWYTCPHWSTTKATIPSLLRTSHFPEWMKMDFKKGMATVDPGDARQIFYHDIASKSEQDKLIANLDTQNIGVFASPQKYAAWRHIPSTCVICTLDRSAISPAVAKAMIEAARAVYPEAFDVVEAVEAGHCVMASQPEWFAGMCVRAAGGGL